MSVVSAPDYHPHESEEGEISDLDFKEDQTNDVAGGFEKFENNNEDTNNNYSCSNNYNHNYNHPNPVVQNTTLSNSFDQDNRRDYPLENDDIINNIDDHQNSINGTNNMYPFDNINHHRNNVKYGIPKSINKTGGGIITTSNTTNAKYNNNSNTSGNQYMADNNFNNATTNSHNMLARETQRKINSKPLADRLSEPVSAWCVNMPFSEQLQDYRNLRDKFLMTNRYLLFTGFPSYFYEDYTLDQMRRLLELWVGRDLQYDMEIITLDDVTAIGTDNARNDVNQDIVDDETNKNKQKKSGKGLHVAYKARQAARMATSRLNVWLRTCKELVSAGLSIADIAIPFEADYKSLEGDWVPDIKKMVEWGYEVSYEWVGPTKASQTIWIGNLKEIKAVDSYGRETKLIVDLLRVMRHFGYLRHYRLINPLGCLFVAFYEVEDAIRCRNSLFGWCVGDNAEACLNIDFSAMEVSKKNYASYNGGVR